MITLEHYQPGRAQILSGEVPNNRLQNFHSTMQDVDHILPLAIGILSRVVANTGLETQYRTRLIHRGAVVAVMEMSLHGWSQGIIKRALHRRVAHYTHTKPWASAALAQVLRDLGEQPVLATPEEPQ